MLDQLRRGDTVIVWKLDRLARSTRDLLETMETIREAGARFQSLSEPWANTTTHAGKLIMTVFAGIAEFERDLIRERTSAGRKQPGDEAFTLDALVNLTRSRQNWHAGL
jgi:DNA invertase Pin-like site-specific DNA recombinase